MLGFVEKDVQGAKDNVTKNLIIVKRFSILVFQVII
jgi:hypothetical protein